MLGGVSLIYSKTNEPMKKAIIENDGELIVPQVKYKTVAVVNNETVFTGRTMPMPAALFEYLSGNEMKVFAIVLKNHREHGCCIVKSTSIAKQLGITHISVANIFARLKNMGLMHFEAAGKKRNKIIDWDTVNVLDKMSANWRAGGLTAMRKKLRDKDICRIIPSQYSDIRAQYEINNDPVENEEYD